MKVYKKFMNAVTFAEKVVLVITMLIIVVITVANVLARYVISQSWAFAEELVVAVFVLISLVAAALCAQEGSLVSLTLFTDLLPKQTRKPVVILTSLATIIFMIILFKTGLDKVAIQLANGKRTFVLNWPEWWFWIYVPIGAACIILHTIEHCLDVCLAKNTDEEEIV